MNEESDSALNRAGTALLHTAMLQAKVANKPGQPQLNDTGYRALLIKARRTLATADLNEKPHKFMAVRTALESLEASERGDDDLKDMELFKSFTEAVLGGPRELEFGGRPRQGQKFAVEINHLRAAAVALWERFPEMRGSLVSEARVLMGVGTKAKLESIVENFNARHDVDIAKSKSPLSIHMPLISDLIEHHGYRKLRDFT